MAQTAQQDKAGTQRTGTGTSTGGVMDTAKDVAGKVGDAASGAVQTVKEMAGDAASYIGRQAHSATSAMGSGMRSVGGAIESGQKYVTEHSVSDMANDLAGVIRRNPIPALLLAAGLGFIMARAMRA